MFAFMAPVPYHTLATLAIFVLYGIAEVFTVRLLKPAVAIVERLNNTPAETHTATLWEWISAPLGSGAALRHALIALLCARLIFSVFAWARETARTWHSMHMVFFMRGAVYDRLQHVGFSFHDEHATGTLINRALSDLQNVRHFVLTVAHTGLDILIALIGFFAMLWFDVSPKIAFAALAPIPFWTWAIRRFAILSQPIYRKQVKASDHMVNVLTENIAGVHVVRAFASEKQEIQKFNDANSSLLQRLLEGVWLRVSMNPLVRGIAAVAHIGLFLFGAKLIFGDELSIAALTVIGAAMGAILGRIQQINAISDAYQQAIVSSGRLFEILDSKDTTPQAKDALPLRPGAGAVTFRHVHFSYKPGVSVLNDVSFSVPAGSFVALVGPTGSGKSTLASLLGRFYDTDLGNIEIDGQDVQDVTVRSVRESVGYVFQETYLFSDSIARNIAYADLDAPLEKVKEAARIANADEFIEKLPEKYHNRIGEYGATLSGGQKQRLAIARAILHNPRVLVMDDSLSAVDPKTEAEIRTGLTRIMKGRTVFMITSRISTARRADKIIVLENGRITQTGTHADLLEQPGYYRDVAMCQFGIESESNKPSHIARMRRMSESGIFQRPTEAEIEDADR